MTKRATTKPEAPPTPPAKTAYAPSGALALLPEAYGVSYDSQVVGSMDPMQPICIVPIQGPLMQVDDWWFDSYESIRGRVDVALEARPRAIVLSISSPGGLVAGCFETAQAIREKCAAAGVPLYAYVDGQATSAAYALASSASSIWCPETGTVGSVGVITTVVDVTALDKAYGLRYEIITSGARKSDGNPHVALSEAALASMQAHINELAAVFFKHVGAERGLDPKTVQAWQAGVFIGASALTTGLVDRVGTIEQLCAAIEAGDRVPGPTKTIADQSASSASSAGRNEPTMKTLLRALGLGDNASEAEALAAVQGMQGDRQRLLVLSGKATIADAEAAFIAWKVGAEKGAAVEAELVAFKKTQLDTEAKTLIDSAVVEGRLPPANRAIVQGQYEAHGLDALKSTLALLQPVVKPAVATPEHPRANTNDATPLTEADREAIETMGITEAQFLKFRQAEAARTNKGGAA